MVSILSFFQKKKKGKRTRSRSPSPTSSSSPNPSSNPTGAAAGPSSNPNPKPTRFLSIRQKSGSSSISGRRNSTDSKRKKSIPSNKPKSDLTSAFQPLPKLDLDFDIPKTEDAIQQDHLDIHGVGEKVPLRQDEVDLISKLELSVDEVRLAWEVVGKALRESDLNTHGLMLPLRPNTSSTTQLYLLALYTLTIRPDLLPKFPTISAQFAQPTSNPSEIWKERLISILKDVDSTSDLAEILKYTIRRLHPIPPEPLIDLGLYNKFIQAEQSSQYPLDAFETLLVPRLKAGMANYLNEIFEVWSAIITHAEENAMIPGRLVHLLGWWTWGAGNESYSTWEKLYESWKNAGGRMEHLLYVWIRSQSTKGQLPIRLLEFVDKYPFDEISASSQHLPLPPSASTSRSTLHITLTSSLPVSDLFQTPEDILKSSLSSKVDEESELPLWSSLRGEGDVQLRKILAEDSLKFLREASRVVEGTPPPSPRLSEQRTPAQVDNAPLYRPFSSMSNGSASRGRFHSHSGDVSSPPTRLSTSTTSPNLASPDNKEVEDVLPKSVKKQASLSVLPKNGNSAWDDFSKSGFGDSPKTVNDLGLAFSPKSTSQPLSPTTSEVRLGGGKNERRPANRKRATFDDMKTPKADFGIAKEEIIEIDDTFISFVEDAQLDPPAVTSWPPFTLVRLASPLSESESGKQIEWLLITVTHRPPPPPEPKPEPTPEATFERSTSPSSSRAGQPRGFKGITESFKRSSSFQSGMALRKSFFGTSNFTLSRHTSDELATLPESQSGEARELRAPLSAQSLTPTEYTITEMGEMIKIPSPNEKAQQAISNPPTSEQSLSVEKDTDVVTIKGTNMELNISSGPSSDSLASQWQYIGEGAEHIVFSNRGNLSKYNGKVLRLRKSQFLSNSPTDPEYRQTMNEWIINLLPKLISPDLLIITEEVILSEHWLKDLFTQADATRPEERKLLGDLKTLVIGDAKGVIMEDTTTNEKQDGIANLAFEIKPKWGFLPDPSTISPPNAAKIKSKNCRFCMHRHLKGHDSSAEGKFCPLDLYSGDETRMRKAIKGLWGIWEESGGKENNWRVFVNGERIHPDKVNAIATYFKGDDLADEIASKMIPIINSSAVFQTLKTLQSTFDPTDISDLSTRFSSAYPNFELFDSALIPSPNTPEMKEFIELYLSSPLSGKKEEIWSLRQRMIAFALSAIFKDCSVFVKFTLRFDEPIEPKWNSVEGSGKVKIIDLDLKPIQNLRKWKETDDKIWKYWLETHPPIASPVTTENKGVQNPVEQEIIFTEDAKGEVEQSLDIPIRHKAISGLTIGVSEYGSALDGASTRALYVNTPDRTGENTPLPTPLPASVSAVFVPYAELETRDESQPGEIANQEDQSKESLEKEDDKLDESLKQVDELEMGDETAEDINISELPNDTEIEPRRIKRSMAPSPSLPLHAQVELPKEEDLPLKANLEDVKTVDLPEQQIIDDSSAKEEVSIATPIIDKDAVESDKTVVEESTIPEVVETIAEAGLAGVGVVLGLAAGAVHTVLESLGESIPEEGKEKDLADVDDLEKVESHLREIEDNVNVPENNAVAASMSHCEESEQPAVDTRDIQVEQEDTSTSRAELGSPDQEVQNVQDVHEVQDVLGAKHVQDDNIADHQPDVSISVPQNEAHPEPVTLPADSEEAQDEIVFPKDVETKEQYVRNGDVDDVQPDIPTSISEPEEPVQIGIAISQLAQKQAAEIDTALAETLLQDQDSRSDMNDISTPVSQPVGLPGSDSLATNPADEQNEVTTPRSEIESHDQPAQQEIINSDEHVDPAPLPESVEPGNSDLVSTDAIKDDDFEEEDNDATPQAEFDSFYTPAETPLNPNTFNFNQPIMPEFPSAPIQPEVAQGGIEEINISKLDDTPQNHDQTPPIVGVTEDKDEEQVDQIDEASSVGTPKLTFIPIEDATPQRDRPIDHSDDHEPQSSLVENAAQEYPIDHLASDEVNTTAIQEQPSVIAEKNSSDHKSASPDEDKSGEEIVQSDNDSAIPINDDVPSEVAQESENQTFGEDDSEIAQSSPEPAIETNLPELPPILGQPIGVNHESSSVAEAKAQDIQPIQAESLASVISPTSDKQEALTQKQESEEDKSTDNVDSMGSIATESNESESLLPESTESGTLVNVDDTQDMDPKVRNHNDLHFQNENNEDEKKVESVETNN